MGYNGMCGTHPFPASSALANIQGRYYWPPEAGDVYSSALCNWTRRLLTREPANRPSAAQLEGEVKRFRSICEEPPEFVEHEIFMYGLIPIQERGDSYASAEDGLSSIGCEGTALRCHERAFQHHSNFSRCALQWCQPRLQASPSQTCTEDADLPDWVCTNLEAIEHDIPPT